MEKKKKWLEYLQQLQDKVLVKDAILLEGTERLQVVGSKCKKVTSRNEKEQWPFKKARGKQLRKYCRDAIVKMGGTNSCERCVCTRQFCLVHYSR